MNRMFKTSVAFATVLTPSLALAAEEGGGGMPQLDVTTFPSQLFWLAIAFSVLFILMWKVAVPRVGDVIEAREQKIRADLERAEQLRDEIAETEAEVEKALSTARAEAQDIVRKAQEKINSDHAKKQEKLDAELSERVAEAESRINAAREEAMASVKDVARDVAAASIEKLTGDKADDAAVSKAVDGAAKGA
jgi:F-type H+-transporting ATPase subunit b